MKRPANGPGDRAMWSAVAYARLSAKAVRADRYAEARFYDTQSARFRGIARRERERAAERKQP